MSDFPKVPQEASNWGEDDDPVLQAITDPATREMVRKVRANLRNTMKKVVTDAAQAAQEDQQQEAALKVELETVNQEIINKEKIAKDFERGLGIKYKS